MPFYKRGVISKTGQETFFFISKIIHLHYNHSYFKGLLLVQFFSLFPGFFRTVYYVSSERSFETGRISVMKGSRRVLVKVVLFHLRERGHPQDDATPNFFTDSKRPILGLSNEVSFVPEILWEGG